MEKVIFHLDMDAFFASCLQEKYPHLRNQPIVVGKKHQRSITYAVSYEARKYGLKAAMPIYKCLELYPKVIVVEPEYDYFEVKSNQIKEVIESFTKDYESFSIDEHYIDMTKIWPNYGTVANLAIVLQTKIYQITKLTCSIGISYNKFLAKMGSDMNKPNGIEIIRKNDIQKKIWPLKIEDMFGVGIKTERLLKANGIETIKDFITNNDETIKIALGRQYQGLLDKALGNSKDHLIDRTRNDKSLSISKETTIVLGTSSPDEINGILLTLTKKVLTDLKEIDSKAKTVFSFHRYKNVDNVFNRDQQIKRIIKQISLSDYTNELETIFAYVKETFYSIYNDDEINLIGVGVTKIKKQHEIANQLDFNPFF